MLGLLLDWTAVAASAARLTPVRAALPWLRGLLFVSLWYTSICAGLLFLYCPLLPLLLLHQRLFRHLTDIVFAAWELYPAALLECILGIRIVVTGDVILPHERSILIMNHRTRTDWNFLWAAMFHASQPLAHRLKFVLKDPIRHIPGPGWVMQLTCFLFIHRNWERDKHLLAKALDYFSDIGHVCQAGAVYLDSTCIPAPLKILLFPEGTDLTESSRQRSHQFATTHGLEHYHYVLHPKTTGFVFLVQRMRQNRQLEAVYDLTVGYPCHIPQQETDLLKGRFPQEVHFNIKRFPTAHLPTDEAELRMWVAEVWRKKERVLHDFYACGCFRDTLPVEKPDSPLPDLSGMEPSVPGPCLSLSSKPSDVQHLLPSPDYSQLDTLPMQETSSSFSTNTAPPCDIAQGPASLHSSALYLSLLFWTLLSFLLLLGLLLSYLIQIWVVVNCFLFFALSLFTEGTHLLEISLYRLKRKFVK